jgi:hypothetical protein
MADSDTTDFIQKHLVFNLCNRIPSLHVFLADRSPFHTRV